MNKTQIKNAIDFKNQTSIKKGHKLIYTRDNKTFICNGFIFLILQNNCFEGIEKALPEDKSGIETKFNESEEKNIYQIDIDLNSVKEFKKTLRSHLEKPYIIEYNNIKYCFNSKYILDIFKILGNKTVAYISNSNKDPLYFKSEYGVALLMPVWLKD